MYPRTCVLPLALGFLVFALVARGQNEPLPPIFAPRESRPASVAPPAMLLRTPTASGVSSSMRQVLFTASLRVLEEMKAFEVPGIGTEAVGPLQSVGDTVQMPRFYVKARPPTEREVRPPELPLYTFTPLERDDPRMIGGISATLMRWGNRSLELNLIQGQGRGADHSREFNRVELGYKIRF